MVNRRSIQFTFLAVLFVITAILSFFVFKPYLNILILAATFAVVFYPLYRGIERHMPRFPGVAAFATVCIASTIIFTPLTYLGFQVYGEASAVYAQFNANADNEIGPLGNISPSSNPLIAKLQEKFEGGVSQLTENLRGIFDWMLTNASQFFQNAANLMIGGFLWILAFYYFLRDGHKIRDLLVNFSPLADRYDKEILGGLIKSIKSVVGGTLIIALVHGILAGVAMTLFGVPNASIWAILTVIAALVPPFGTALVILPAVGYLLLINQTVPAIGLFIFWVIVMVNIIDNMLRPKLFENTTGLHPLVILLSVVGGLAFFGPVGFLTGPIILTFMVQLLNVYREMAAPTAE